MLFFFGKNFKNLAINLVYRGLTLFPWSPQNAKESDLGHVRDLLYIFCGKFNENLWGFHLKFKGKVNRQSQRARGEYNFFQFLIFLITILGKKSA